MWDGKDWISIYWPASPLHVCRYSWPPAAIFRALELSLADPGHIPVVRSLNISENSALAPPFKCFLLHQSVNLEHNRVVYLSLNVAIILVDEQCGLSTILQVCPTDLWCPKVIPARCGKLAFLWGNRDCRRGTGGFSVLFYLYSPYKMGKY